MVIVTSISRGGGGGCGDLYILGVGGGGDLIFQGWW